MKKLILLFTLFALSFTSACSHIADEEEPKADTAAVEEEAVERDMDYYTRLADENITINVYNWGEYIPDGSDEDTINLNAEFTELTGIKVNYTTYATNEELYAKLKGGSASYDIIVPSDYMISRMIKEDMLEPLNMKNIPNFENIMERFRNPEYDPSSRYSVPYTWGTIGLIYDNTVFDEADKIGWETLWDEKYAGNILMFDNPRDAFAIAELVLGYDLNTEDPDELRKSAELLTEQKKNVQAYVMDEIFDKMGAGEAVIAPYYAGDGVMLMDEYDHLGFTIPEKGTNLFIDAVCIPKGSKNKEAAEMYINFLCEPDIAYAVADFIGYSTPNNAAYELVDEEADSDSDGEEDAEDIEEQED